MLGHTNPQYNAVMTQRALLAAFTLCAMAPAQELTTRPSFEVASIKPADPAIENNFWVGMDANAGMVRYNNITLRDCESKDENSQFPHERFEAMKGNAHCTILRCFLTS